jgi:hypothetical protein
VGGSGKAGGGELALLDIGALVLLLALKSARGRGRLQKSSSWSGRPVGR